MEKENAKIGLTDVKIREGKQTEDFGLIFSMYQILLKYGQYTLQHSFSVRKSFDSAEKYRYSISSSKTSKILHNLWYIIVGFFWVVDLVGDRISASQYSIINWIKKLTHILFLVQYIMYYFCMEGRRKQNMLLNIFVQFDVVQSKFASLGIKLISQPKLKMKIFAFSVCFANTVGCLAQAIIFTAKRGSTWAERPAENLLKGLTLTAVDFNIVEVHSAVKWILSLLAIIMTFIFNHLLYFCDSLLIITIVSIWIVFRRLNTALDTNFLTHDDLREVVDLHLNASKLMNLINQWISPLILVSTVSTLLYICFWTNYMVQDFNLRLPHIVTAFFLLRNAFIYIMAADVNSKAHQVSAWLELGCTEKEKLPDVDNNKMLIFTNQVYNRDTIGFRGLNYFTITSAFLSAIIGLIMTYTIVITQFIVDSNTNSTSGSGAH